MCSFSLIRTRSPRLRLPLMLDDGDVWEPSVAAVVADTSDSGIADVADAMDGLAATNVSKDNILLREGGGVRGVTGSLRLLWFELVRSTSGIVSPASVASFCFASLKMLSCGDASISFSADTACVDASVVGAPGREAPCSVLVGPAPSVGEVVGCPAFPGAGSAGSVPSAAAVTDSGGIAEFVWSTGVAMGYVAEAGTGSGAVASRKQVRSVDRLSGSCTHQMHSLPHSLRSHSSRG